MSTLVIVVGVIVIRQRTVVLEKQSVKIVKNWPLS